MRIHDPLRGGGAARLSAGLLLALHLAVAPVAAGSAGGTVVVDRLNGFSLVLPAGWSASVPAEEAVDGATVLRKRPPGEPPANLQEGEVAGAGLKIQLTAVQRDRYQAGGGIADSNGTRVRDDRPLATRIAGLEAIVSTRTWSPGARVLEVAMTAGDERILVADLNPSGSPDLVEALAILETIRVDGVPADPASTVPAALERAAKLAERVAAPPTSALGGGLTVINPVGDSALGTGLRYPVTWRPSGTLAQVDIDLLDANGPVLAIARDVIDGATGSFEWRVPRGLDLENGGPYRVLVTIGDASGQSDEFSIAFACGEGTHDGAEADISPLDRLHMPFQIGTEWTVGGHGSFYGSGFHCNHYNDYYATDWNSGDDEGEPVLAVAKAVVGELPACNDGALGCSVELHHSQGVTTVYGHLQARYVREGQTVSVGYHLGDLGDTGNSNGAHLHLRFRVSGGSGEVSASRCDTPGLCPNGEEPLQPQTEKPSPMLVWSGSTLEEAELIDGVGYVAGNGIRVTEPAGGEVYAAGQAVTIRWQSEMVKKVSVELTRGGQRWVLFTNVTDREKVWTVPDNLPCGTGYRIRVAGEKDPGVNDLSDEVALDMPSCGLSIHPPTLPVGIVGQDYSQSLVLLGGSPPWRMQVGVGTALPDGLILADYGVIEGRPVAAGTSHFTIVAKDSAGSIVEQEYSLSIAEAELCNGLDDDGDGNVDEDDACLCRTAEYTGFTYSICDAVVDWYDAARACSARGLALVEIESANENNWLAGEGAGLNRWIGLTDAATEGNWHWTDGSPLGSFFAGWGPAEPNGGTAENCVELYFENTEWNDRSCGWSNGFVCQETIVPSDFLCLTGRLIYNDPYYGILTGPVDHPVDRSIDSPGPGWTPIEPLVPDADGRFCSPVLWERRYLLSELVGPPGPVRVCQTVIEPTDPDSTGTCGGNESGCEELGDVDFFCGS